MLVNQVVNDPKNYSKIMLPIRDSRSTHRYYSVKFGTHGEERYKYDMREVYQHALRTTRAIHAKDPSSTKFQVVLQFRDGSYRSGPRTATGADPIIWNPTDSNDVDHGDVIGFHFNFDLSENAGDF